MLIEGASQDLQVLIPGDTLPVTPGPIMRRTRWVGGVYVMFVNPIDVNDWLVEVSNGIAAAGFIMSPSENYQDPRGGGGYRNWTSMQPSNKELSTLASGASTQTMVAGGGRFLFKHFETISLTVLGVRSGPPLVYSLNDNLYVSENGLITNDDPARIILATGGTQAVLLGLVSTLPDARSGFRVGMDHKF